MKTFIASHKRLLVSSGVAVVALLALAWLLRPLGIIRGPFMLFYRHPMLVTLPVIVAVLSFAVSVGVSALRGRFSKANREVDERDRGDRRGFKYGLRSEFASYSYTASRRAQRSQAAASLMTAGAVAASMATVAFCFASIATGWYTGRAIYQANDYGKVTPAELAGAQVRIKPHDVASKQLDNSLNSSTEKVTNMHITKVDGKLRWTATKDPDGFFRTYTKRTNGAMSADGQTSAVNVDQGTRPYSGEFKVGPGMKFSDGIKWRAAKDHCYTCDIQEMTAVPTAKGPVIIAPYVKYKGGLFVRRPEFGGVYLITPDGRIANLSPKQAAANEFVAQSGRLFPEKLARRIADAYQYKGGIINRLFTHTDQLEVADTDEGNAQPYLQDFKKLGLQWATTLKPRGKSNTTAGVMVTDAVSGRTRIWRAPKNKTLIGNQKAPDIVRGESIPGITFADSGASDAGGKFRVVEPRQVFPGGKLQFLVTIIPNAANRSTRSVIVDAASQQVVAQFPATAEGDADLIDYLNTGKLADEDEFDSADDENPDEGEPGSGPAVKAPKGTDAKSTLQRLLKLNRDEQRTAQGRVQALKAQEADLRRLLQAAEKR